MTHLNYRCVMAFERSWTPVREFTSPGCDVIVIVHQSNDRRPILSYSIGRRKDGNEISRHFGAFYDTQAGGGLKNSRVLAITKLTSEAEDFILTEYTKTFEDKSNGRSS